VIIYYISYCLSFLPVVGVGKIVVSKSFMSYIFALTKTVLYGTYNPLYFSSTPPSSALPNINTSLGGNIYWLAAIIIWVAMTFSQRYDRKMPQGYDLFYYIVGVHLFYIGIASSLSVYPLSVSGNL
jgi:type IV secretory pathway VirB2 component (pilin)